ncbi:MAG: DUF4942 domain-containing protein [Ruminococcus flavefaciens]|nr:DUF4942 domain-containing protein [Ruminococcus flavefaciens]
MFTDCKEFYPTPQNIINKMICDLDFSMINSILEPSAGKGNIVDELKKKEENHNKYYGQKNYHFDIDCIEADQNLQHILKGKNFRVVYNDFLTYDTMKEYDLIIMNPPFSNGCKHLLKALEMQQRNGGAVVCLLNAETLKNLCTNERVDLKRKLTEYNAKIEFIQDAFLDAERKTAVEIAIIKVQLPEVKRESFILDGLKKAQEQREYTEAEQTQLINSDFFKAIVNQYQLEVEAGIKLIKEYFAIQPFILSQFGKDEKTGETVQKGDCILSLDIGSNRDKYSNKLSVNKYIREVRRKYWSALFKNPKFIGQLTNNLQQYFYNKVEELSGYDFSLYNIYQLKIDMQKKVVKGIEETIIALFDEFSNKYHYYDETSKNIHYYNGWKTNKAWIINKKVIIPLNGYHDLGFSWGGFRPTDYKIIRKLQDIEKCFNYLDGGLTEAVDLEESLKFAEEYGETKDIQLKYFTVTFYKKGTCHITFNNDELLKKFNIFGSQYKGWLPPSYGKKTYKDMTTEEKSVVNEFEGEKEYNKVIANKEYYLFDGNNLNLLEDKTA